jgi:hypothetical protein
MRPDGVALKNHADRPTVGGDKRAVGGRKNLLACDQDLAAVGFFQSGDAAQGGGLAAARWAE